MNGWTGAQYSVYRVLLGSYTLVHFASLLPWGSELFSNRGMLPDASSSPLYPLFPNPLFLVDSPAFVAVLIGLGVALSVSLVLGLGDRAAAVGVWFVSACLFTRNPLIANPSLPFVGWLLLAHALIPRAPYGSWAARGRDDPGGGWTLPQPLFAIAWIVMSLGYSYSGYTKLASPSWLDGSALAHVLENPLARPTLLRDLLLTLPAPLLQLATFGGLALELLFAPLALLRRLRPWLWLALVGMHATLLVLVDFADLTVGMLVLHAFTFDPAWLRPRPVPAAGLHLYYDGSCGLCHRAVRFVLAEDARQSIRFAPLDSEAFRTAVPEADRARLPDSLVLRVGNDSPLTRSRALIQLGLYLGGLWFAVARIAALVPTSLLDALYDRIAAVRHRLFGKPPDACPILPRELRARFDT